MCRGLNEGTDVKRTGLRVALFLAGLTLAGAGPLDLVGAQTNPNVNTAITASGERPTPSSSCNASESVTAQRAVLINRGDTAVEARWLNYNCTETAYFTIAPHSQQAVNTFETHLWRFYEINSNVFLNEFRIIPHDPNLLAVYYTGRGISHSPTACNGSDSTNGRSARFHNYGVTPVRARWLNFDCTETSYGVIEPGQTLIQPTYLTHVWRFYEQTSEVLLAETRISDLNVDAEFGRKVAPTCNASHSFLPVTVNFVNLGDFPVEPRWLNYDCTETSYAVIPARSANAQATFKTHLWRFYLAGTNIPIGESRIANTTSVAFGRFLPPATALPVPPTTATTTSTEPPTTTAQPLVFEFIQIITPSTTVATTTAPPTTTSPPAIPATTTGPTTTSTTSTTVPHSTSVASSVPSTTTAPTLPIKLVKPGVPRFQKVCKNIIRNKRKVLVCSLVRI